MGRGEPECYKLKANAGSASLYQPAGVTIMCRKEQGMERPIFATNLVLNISHSKKNSVKYFHKYA